LVCVYYKLIIKTIRAVQSRAASDSLFSYIVRLTLRQTKTYCNTILFAYRTQNYDELNVWRELDGRLSFYLSGSGALFYLPPLSTFGTHLCITWDSVTGLSAFWVDGRQSSYQLYKKGHSIRPGGTVLLIKVSPAGNVFDWNTIKYKINGNVLVAQNN
uniref:Pentraxin family member n=1 Tax=Cyprinus carpio TaxID=7962 RepID=A0A8C2Q6W0_CYPCA